ncbi:MAG: ABC transporter ATP-binding protein [Lentisphaerae bacterium]|nr:ABC transporter ATP-binding protein [Lentisphaerota bacterium]
MQPLIAIRELGKTYRQGETMVTALEDISLDIASGEFVALMGPSGSGKTTLLNIMAGIDRPTGGSVTIDGVRLDGMTEAQRTAWRTRGVGYIFQFYNLIPVLTAYENVELPLLTLPLSRRERHAHVTAALEAVGIAARARHFPRQLSGGEEQRVAIARAIVTDAGILVADEPTGNLDAGSEQAIMTLIRELNRRFGKTVILVTHDHAAADFAGRIMRLEKGRLISTGKEN